MERKEEFESRYGVINTLVFQRTKKRKWQPAVAEFKGGIFSFLENINYISLKIYIKKRKYSNFCWLQKYNSDELEQRAEPLS